MVVLDRRRGSGLTQEPLPGTITRSQGRQHCLESHDPVQMRVLSAEDHSHAPNSDDLQYTERAEAAQLVERLRQSEEGA